MKNKQNKEEKKIDSKKKNVKNKKINNNNSSTSTQSSSIEENSPHNSSPPPTPDLTKSKPEKTKKKNSQNKILVGMKMENIEDLSDQVEVLHSKSSQIGNHPHYIPITRPRRADEPPFIPSTPQNISESGLSESFIEQLCLKHIFQGGDMSGSDITYRTALPPNIIEDVMEKLRKQKLVEITGSRRTGIGRSQMIFTMTSAGYEVCKHSMRKDRYVGPAPVPYKYYLKVVKTQSIHNNQLQMMDIKPFFKDLTLPDSVFDAIGPAMNSGKALFFHGPPGNGKTAICQRMTNCFGGDIFIPYSVLVDDFVIKLFDENIHQISEEDSYDPKLDARWIRCNRPIVITGGELTLDDLDLSYSESIKYYEAPIQMKANNGLLLVDDFGRQKVSPKDLLNRWIIPLENEYDFISLHTGKKLEIPFDVFTVFSTNLDPGDLVDRAFLRRVRYKLEVKQPTADLYQKIFLAECEKRNIPFNKKMFDYLINKHYKLAKRNFNACEPRDLLEQVEDLCSYRGYEPILTKEILDQVAANYFVDL
ncbi:MAG: ATPase [Myxococcota bacterium]